MRTCRDLSPLSFAHASLSLDCLPPEELVCSVDRPKTAFHLDIRKADLQLRWVPREFHLELPWAPDLEVQVGSQGEIRSALSIRNNEIPLALRSLLFFQDIRVDGPGDLDFSPDRLLVGEYGGLHLLIGVSPDWYERIADPERFPDLGDLHSWLGLPAPPLWCAPLGAEQPAVIEYCEAEPRPRSHAAGRLGEFASREDPRLDLAVTPWIPRWLAEQDRRLPERMNWMELAHRWIARPPDPPGKNLLEKILENIVLPDGGRPFRLGDLLAGGEALFEMEDFSLRLDPMQLGGVRLTKGEIRAGVEGTAPWGEAWPAGWVAEWDFEDQQLKIRANVDLELAMHLPWIGEIGISTPILFSAWMEKVGGRLDLIPGSFFLELPDLKIGSPAWEGDLSFQLTLKDEGGEFKFQLKGGWGGLEKSMLAATGNIPISVHHGRYQWAELGDDLEIFSSVEYQKDKDPALEAELYFNTLKSAPFVSDPSQPDFGFRLRAGLFRDGKPLLEGGELQVQRIELEREPFGRKSLFLIGADAEYLEAGEVVLRDLSARAEWEQSGDAAATSRFYVPRLSIAANPGGSEAGWVRGPVRAELDSRERPLQVVWDRSRRQIRIQDLEIQVSAQQIQLPPILKTKQQAERARIRREGLRPPSHAVGFGVDGKILGDFEFNLGDFSGSGELRLVGDRQGDVYLLSRQGTPLDPPLFKKTDWRFSRVDKVLLRRGYALGAFRLFTRMNTRSLKHFGHLLDYETEVIMVHRDIMLKLGGIDAVNGDYYRRLYRELLRQMEGEVGP